MSEPRRLLETEPEGLARELLEYGAKERPSQKSQALIAAAALSALAATQAATGTAVAGTAAAVVKASWWSSLWTWAGLGAILAGTATGTVYYAVQSSHSVPEPAQSSPLIINSQGPAQPQASSPIIEPPSSAQIEVAEPQEPPKEPPAKPSVKPRSSETAPASPIASDSAPVKENAPPSDPLAIELASVDKARQSLASGDPQKALDALETHDKAVGTGALEPEVKVIRIEALLRKGDKLSASQLAQEFLTAWPNSPHAPRVRSLLQAAQMP